MSHLLGAINSTGFMLGLIACSTALAVSSTFVRSATWKKSEQNFHPIMRAPTRYLFCLACCGAATCGALIPFAP